MSAEISKFSAPNDESALLSWSRIGGLEEALGGPLIVAGPPGKTTDVVLSRLAAELVSGGGRVLWVNSRKYLAPLAWAQARTYHADLGNTADWPAISPLDFTMGALYSWIVLTCGVEDRSLRSALSMTIGRLYGLSAGRRIEMGALRDALFDLRIAPERVWPRENVPFLDETKTAFDASSFRVVALSGTRADFVQHGLSAVAFCLAVLSQFQFWPKSTCDLVILDDVWDWLDVEARKALAFVLNFYASEPNQRVIITTNSPASWKDERVDWNLLLHGFPIVTSDFDADWPSIWGSDPPTFPEDPSRFPCVAVYRNMIHPVVGRPADWAYFRVPSPLDVPVPGMVVVDLEDENVPWA